MALINFFPHRSGPHYWDVWDWPQRLVHQNFGLDLRDFDAFFDQQLRPDRSGTSEVANNENKFEVRLDCRHFKPEELTVKTVGNNILIHGKHEERDDKNGFISREFSRRYALPEGCDAEKVISSLDTNNGFLKIEAPKKALPEPMEEQREIPITVDNESQNAIKN